MSFKIVSGVCRPQTFESLEDYKGLQRALNRVLDVQGEKLLFVDGRIGSKTIAAINKALGTSYGDCAAVADKVSTLIGQLTSFANSRQLPVVADPENIVRSTFTPPSRFDEDTGNVVHPGMLTVPFWYVALLGLGGYYYFYKTQPGKKARKALARKF